MITPFPFQDAAATQVADRFIEYLGDPVLSGTQQEPRYVPFLQALSSLTGSGKTVILAQSVNQIAASMPVAPVVLWLSRGKVVVRQAFANLADGGRYHHLLGSAQVVPLADYSPSDVRDARSPLVYFATVGTFTQRDKEEGTLTIYQSDVDATEESVWEALKHRRDLNGVRRPLLVVYDEGHNLSDLQTELLLELEPSGFLLASATMRLPSRMAGEVEALKRAGWGDERLVTSVSSSDVVASGLVKGTLLLAGYNSPMEETISSMLRDLQEAEEEAVALGLDFLPKAIYVCNTNIVSDNASQSDDPKLPFGQRQAPPIRIWRYLTEQCGVDPGAVAVYANLKTHRDAPLPDDFVLYKGADRDYENFTAGNYRHIIFNLTLQEGWDDPAAYFAYVDKSMESNVQITQIVGRVLRQPHARHFGADRLNTAHFYVRVDRNEVFNSVLDDVNDRLGSEVPEVRIVASAPGTGKPQEYRPRVVKEIPETGVLNMDAREPVASLFSSFTDYRESDANTRGQGARRIAMQKVGAEAKEGVWETFEEASKVSARWVFYREVIRRHRRALHVVNLAEPKLNAQIGIGSPAYAHVCVLAEQVVNAYIENAILAQRKPNPYVVGPILARPADVKPFQHALHEGYAGLNSIELAFAKAVDGIGVPWVRNPSRSGYGIPLISVGPTETFYPDFVCWLGDRVICVDTKGPQLVAETALRKLLRIRPHPQDARTVEVLFVSEGKWNKELQQEDGQGYTQWGLKEDRSLRVRHHASMGELVVTLFGSRTLSSRHSRR